MQQIVKKVFVGDGKPIREKLNLRNYTHIRGYHACRPVNVSNYIENGIKVFEPHELQNTGITLFKLNIGDIMTAASRVSVRKPQVYFSVFKEALLSHSGHYLCYGGEYLTCLAARLDGDITGKYHDILLNTGIPTIFICDVPISYLPDLLINDLNEHYHPQNTLPAFWINRELPREYIIGHEHPAELFDAIRYVPLKNKNTICPMCE